MAAVVRSNCLVWAAQRRLELGRAWVAAGRPIGAEPALRVRCSRLEPRAVAGVKVPHFEVEHWTGTQWVREGWVPIDKRPLRGWGLLRGLWADGEIVIKEISGYDAERT